MSRDDTPERAYARARGRARGYARADAPARIAREERSSRDEGDPSITSLCLWGGEAKRDLSPGGLA